jgi:transposase
MSRQLLTICECIDHCFAFTLWCDDFDRVRRIDHEPSFAVLPRRWVVERAFAWMTRWRPLVRGYERRIDVSKATIHVALGSLLLGRIAH